ncbi:MAG: urease accessory protein UreF [Gammaproteobacteria bacterium]|nr:urease accessory protein UreF [Gammaproteobacteria bacterium]
MPTKTLSSESGELARLRLMQLTSPALPVGGFTYSQGIEWAVEAGWIRDVGSLRDWLSGLIDDGLAGLELPLLVRLYRACEAGEPAQVGHWGRQLLASRETRELRQEELNRARALISLLRDLGIGRVTEWADELVHCQAAPFAVAAVEWRITLEDCLLGYAWSWLENQVAAAIKLVPLGQTDGQRVQLQLAESLPGACARALKIDDDAIGSSAPALAIASARHETQYTRLFRS